MRISQQCILVLQARLLPRINTSSKGANLVRTLVLSLFFCFLVSGSLCAQQWSSLNQAASFKADSPLLLTDGTIMVHEYQTSNWWRLTPDSYGSYVNGTWSQLASMPSNYTPLYFASAVLPDGRVLIEGGEYNAGTQAETTLGAIYTPATNTWAAVTPPAGWSRIGDAQSVVLPNGTFMLGNCCSNTQALFNAQNLTWSTTGAGKADANEEEGWNLLSSGNVLTADSTNGTNSELYNSSSGTWSSAGSTVASLVDTCSEVGPAMLRPDGTVFATGGLSATSIYNSGTGFWTPGPSFPAGTGVSDGPAAILPNGNVLVSASPTCQGFTFPNGTQFYEFDGSNLVATVNPPNAANHASYAGRMLVLPSLQVLYTDGSSNVSIYSPVGTYSASWQPTVTPGATTLTNGSANNPISGTQFNGLTQGAAYGDDAQAASNFPLVRLVNNSSGHVVYATTHDHSTMSVATGSATVSTQFDVPSNIEAGATTLYVVANGIPSAGTQVTINVPSQHWQGQFYRPAYGYNCNNFFDLFIIQADHSTASTNWQFVLEGGFSSSVSPQFSWTLSDTTGPIASGTWTGGANGSYPFTASQAPVGTPVFSINGYYNPSSGCSISLNGNTTLQLQQ